MGKKLIRDLLRTAVRAFNPAGVARSTAIALPPNRIDLSPLFIDDEASLREALRSWHWLIRPKQRAVACVRAVEGGRMKVPDKNLMRLANCDRGWCAHV